MTAVATQQVLANGSRNLILKYTIGGTPLTDASAATLVDISTLDANTNVGGYRLEKATWSLTGMSCKLAWEAAADVDLLELASGDGSVDFSDMGGIANNASLPTGNIVFTTTGYGTAGDGGSMVLEFKKKSSTTVALQQDESPATGSIAITGLLPTLVRAGSPTIGSIAITGGAAPTVTQQVVPAPALDALAITGLTPIRVP